MCSKSQRVSTTVAKGTAAVGRKEQKITSLTDGESCRKDRARQEEERLDLKVRTAQWDLINCKFEAYMQLYIRYWV